MRALVVHESMWGNTRKVAEAISGALADGMDVRSGDVSEVPAGEAGSYDLVVVGAPTHAFSLSRPSTRTAAHEQGAPDSASTTGLREWIADLPTPTGAVLACFDTRADRVRKLPGSAAHKARRMLRRAGWTVLADESFYVGDSPGPLVAGEIERAAGWARHLAEQLSTGSRV
jgi:hypothetical protein